MGHGGRRLGLVVVADGRAPVVAGRRRDGDDDVARGAAEVHRAGARAGGQGGPSHRGWGRGGGDGPAHRRVHRRRQPPPVRGPELALARSWVEGAVAAAPKAAGNKKKAIDVTIGTMIETPRAALRAGEIAEHADFFSFGTNDLTQMTFGFSRDDVEGRMMTAYLEQGLLPRNPFDTLDQDGGRALAPYAQEPGAHAARGHPQGEHRRRGRAVGA